MNLKMLMALMLCIAIPFSLYAIDARDCDIDGDGDVDGHDLSVFSTHYGGTYSLWYLDSDGDGFGDPSVTFAQAEQPQGYVDDQTDCDDEDEFIYPGAYEMCDKKDNDCDGEIDNNDLCLQPEVINEHGMLFKVLPGGSFTMGSPVGEPGRGNELQHEVTLSQPFYMQATEVTQLQWKSVMGDENLPVQISASGYGEGNNHPVYFVSWNDVQNFINVLNNESEKTYRLPTEAEWEYAARAESATVFPNGDITIPYGSDPNLNQIGWYRENAGGVTNVVGQKAPNSFGLYDMHGNVFEWCSDFYGNYPTNPVTDPTGPPSGSYRIARGGHWSSYAANCRSASRNGYDPGTAYPSSGFRLVWIH